jgi:hypothetical protein
MCVCTQRRSAVYFLEGFVLVHYNINYDAKRIANSLPHPLYFARSTSGASLYWHAVRGFKLTAFAECSRSRWWL